MNLLPWLRRQQYDYHYLGSAVDSFLEGGGVYLDILGGGVARVEDFQSLWHADRRSRVVDSGFDSSSIQFVAFESDRMFTTQLASVAAGNKHGIARGSTIVPWDSPPLRNPKLSQTSDVVRTLRDIHSQALPFRMRRNEYRGSVEVVPYVLDHTPSLLSAVQDLISDKVTIVTIAGNRGVGEIDNALW